MWIWEAGTTSIHLLWGITIHSPKHCIQRYQLISEDKLYLWKVCEWTYFLCQGCEYGMPTYTYFVVYGKFQLQLDQFGIRRTQLNTPTLSMYFDQLFMVDLTTFYQSVLVVLWLKWLSRVCYLNCAYKMRIEQFLKFHASPRPQPPSYYSIEVFLFAKMYWRHRDSFNHTFAQFLKLARGLIRISNYPKRWQPTQFYQIKVVAPVYHHQ